MDTYSVLRQFADSWGMLAMFAGFVGMAVYVIFGRRAGYREAANSIFRNEDKPADDPDTVSKSDGKEHDR